MLNVKDTVFIILLVTSIVFCLFVDKNRWITLIPIITTISYWFLINFPEYTQNIRYADMSLTLPLMTTAIYYTSGADTTKILTSILLILLMLMAGLAGNQTKNYSWFILVGLPLMVILYDFLKMKDERPVVYLLFVTWALYPLLWLFKTDEIISEVQKENMYSYIDLVSKIGIVDILWMGS
jgi:bacteriorhodopsin